MVKRIKKEDIIDIEHIEDIRQLRDVFQNRVTDLCNMMNVVNENFVDKDAGYGDFQCYEYNRICIAYYRYQLGLFIDSLFEDADRDG